MSSIYTLGIDVGSTASKCILLKDGKEITAKSLIDVGAGTSGPQRAIDAVLEAANMKREDMAFVLATGYGRNSLMGLADKQMSELSCHARGASFLFPDVQVLTADINYRMDIRKLISAVRMLRSCTLKTVR